MKFTIVAYPSKFSEIKGLIIFWLEFVMEKLWE